MRLIRTFHPVGHGAFYTERFYDGADCVFTAVYDCGGSPVGGIKRYVTNYVKEVSNLNKNGKIDALFISHFHSDHISGVEYLIDKCEKVYIPELTPCEKIYAFVSNGIASHNIDNDANEVIEKLYSKDYKDKVVEVEAINDADNDKIKDNSKAVREEKLEPPIDISSVSGSIKSGMPLRSGVFKHWIYYPFHLQTTDVNTQEIKEFFKGAIVNDKDVDFAKVKDIYIKADKEYKDWKSKHKGKSKEKDAPKDVTNLFRELFDGEINDYSMTVYSGYYNPWNYYFRRWICDHCHCGCERECCCMCANCLYTGDFEFSKEHVSKLISFYKEYWECSRTIQVPHHGSESIGHENYDYSVYSFCKHAVISTTCMHKNVTSLNVILRLKEDNIDTRIVTENPISKYEQKYRIY